MSTVLDAPIAATLSLPSSSPPPMPALSPPRRRRQPPDDDALIAANIRLLNGRRWRPVILSTDPVSLAVEGDAGFERSRSAEPNGRYREFADILVVHAVAAIVGLAPASRIRNWTDVGFSSSTADEIRELFENRVRRGVHREIERRINAGGFGALVALNSPDPSVRNAPIAAAAQTAQLRDEDSARRAPFDAAPPSSQALRRARKYLVSSSMDWELVVLSVDPLKLGVLPGENFGGRFLSHLMVGPGADERDRANKLVVQTLRSMVVHADVSEIMYLASDVDPARLADKSYAVDVLGLYRAAIMERMDTAIDRGGYEALVGLMSTKQGAFFMSSFEFGLEWI